MKLTFDKLYEIFYGKNPQTIKSLGLCEKYGLDNPPSYIRDHTIEFGKMMNISNSHVKVVRHRLDGPAVLRKSGDTIWFINGKYANHLITEWAKENDIELDNLSEVDKALIKIVWADYGK